MVDPVTVNKGLAQPTRGSDVGTWDVPVNGNMGIIDNSFGGVATIPLTNSPVTLSAAQYQCNFLIFTGALSGSVPITFPAVGSFYTVQNLTSNTSNFQVTFLTTAGGQAIGCPWGEPIDVFTDVTNVKFRNLGRVGTYWDYSGSSVPAWVTACTVPPYLNCDGTSFSSATYPILATILGGTTLPDSKGGVRYTLNQGSARLTSSGGVDGNTLLARGGIQTITISSQSLPNTTFPVTDPGHHHSVLGSSPGDGSIAALNFSGVTTLPGFTGGTSPSSYFYIDTAPGGNHQTFMSSNTTGISVATGGTGAALATLPSGYVGGITMIRSA